MSVKEIIEKIISEKGNFDRKEIIEELSKHWNTGYNPENGDILSMFNESKPNRNKNGIGIEDMSASETIAEVYDRIADYLSEGSFGDVAQAIFENDKKAYQTATDITEENPFFFISIPEDIKMEKTIEKLRPICGININKVENSFHVAGGKRKAEKGMQSVEECTTLIMEKLNELDKKYYYDTSITKQQKPVIKALATLIVLNTIADESELDALYKVDDFYAPVILQLMGKIKDSNKSVAPIRNDAVGLAQTYINTIDPLRATFKGREPEKFFHDSKIVNTLNKIATKNSDMNADISGTGRKLAFVGKNGGLRVLPKAAPVELSSVKESLKKGYEEVLGAFNTLDKKLFAEDRTDLIKDSLADTAAIMLANLIVLENTEEMDENIRKGILEQAFMIPFMQSTATLSAEKMNQVVAEALADVQVAAEAGYIDVDLEKDKKERVNKKPVVEEKDLKIEEKKIPDFSGIVKKTTKTFKRAQEFSEAVKLLKVNIDISLKTLQKDSKSAETKKNKYKSIEKQNEWAFNQKISDILIRDLNQIKGYLDGSKEISRYYKNNVVESRGLREEHIELLDDQKAKIIGKVEKLQNQFGYEEGQEVDKEELEKARIEVGLDKDGLRSDLQPAIEAYKNNIITSMQNQTKAQPTEDVSQPEVKVDDLETTSKLPSVVMPIELEDLAKDQGLTK